MTQCETLWPGLRTCRGFILPCLHICGFPLTTSMMIFNRCIGVDFKFLIWLTLMKPCQQMLWDSRGISQRILHVIYVVAKRKRPSLASESPPSIGVCKIIVDGSVLGEDGTAGFGGLIRDEYDTGAWIWGFSGILGQVSMVKDRGINAVHCNSGSRLAVDFILHGVNDHHHYAARSSPWHSAAAS